jgi:hypothetical protein
MSRIPTSLGSLSEIRWSGTLVTSVLAIAITGGVILAEIPGFVAALTTSSWTTPNTDPVAELAARHAEQAEINRRRFSGRSAFNLPSRPKSRPKPPPKRTPVRATEPEAPKGPPLPPASYSGPRPTGILGSLVLFGSAADAVAIGEEKDGVKVLEIMSIWRVRLAHRGGEYEVDLLERKSGMFSEPAAPPSATRRFFEGNETTSASGNAASPPKSPVTKAPRPAETTGPTEPPVESPIESPPTYADPSTLPDAMSDDQIASLSPSDVVMARNRVRKALRREDLDPRSRIRLQHELEQLEQPTQEKTGAESA